MNLTIHVDCDKPTTTAPPSWGTVEIIRGDYRRLIRYDVKPGRSAQVIRQDVTHQDVQVEYTTTTWDESDWGVGSGDALIVYSQHRTPERCDPTPMLRALARRIADAIPTVYLVTEMTA
ncbi:MAG: hypothetical protein H0W42_12560 [Gemmatimonadaceae bacterium]|nr:hypothetical protein [Gemmatimonadaceae bacterium]